MNEQNTDTQALINAASLLHIIEKSILTLLALPRSQSFHFESVNDSKWQIQMLSLTLPLPTIDKRFVFYVTIIA